MKPKHPILATIICSLIGATLFLILHPIANQNRPAPGVGGEMLLAIMPHIVWFLIVPTVRETIQTVNQLFREEL